VCTAVIGDCEPGYASTAKMITECAICLLRDAPDAQHAGLSFEIER
jgi:hypothetical protein